MTWATDSWASAGWAVVDGGGGIVPLSGYLAILRTIPNKLDDWLSARDYGFHPAKTAAENTMAWNNMLSEAQGKVIFVPPGQYRHNGLVIDRDDITVTSGGNMGAAANVQLICDNPNTHALQIMNCSRTRLSGFTVRHGVASAANIAALAASGYTDLQVDHVATSDWSGTGSHTGLRLTHSADRESFLADFQHCEFVGHEVGILLSGGSPRRRVGETTLSHCQIYANRIAGLMVLDYVYGVYIREQCNFGIDNEINLLLAPSAAGRSLDVFLSNCTLDASRKQGILADKIDSVHIVGNWIASAGATSGETVQAWGIQLLAGVQTVDIVGNYLVGNRTGGIHSSAQHAWIDGNHFNTNGQAAAGVAVELTAQSQFHTLGANRFVGHTTNVVNNGTKNDVGIEHRAATVRPMVRGGFHVGDDDFLLALLAGTPTISFAANDWLSYDRSSDTFQWTIGGLNALVLGRNGDQPFLEWDAGDSFRYIRSADRWEWVIGDVVKAILESAGLKTNRLYGNQASTAWTTARFTLSSTWGSTASVSNISATDARGMFRVNSGGTGRAANPTIDLTFADGAWIAPPVILAMQITGTDNIGLCFVQNITTTSFRITWAATPGDGQFYEFAFMCIG